MLCFSLLTLCYVCVIVPLLAPLPLDLVVNGDVAVAADLLVNVIDFVAMICWIEACWSYDRCHDHDY